MIIHKKYQVLGRVQGVFFRASTRDQAKKLEINGTVRNLVDGSVLVEAEGTADQLNEFEKWLKEGPPFSRVDQILEEPGIVQNFNEFVIEY